jgi:hypothetical protein
MGRPRGPLHAIFHAGEVPERAVLCSRPVTVVAKSAGAVGAVAAGGGERDVAHGVTRIRMVVPALVVLVADLLAESALLVLEA